MRDASGSVQNNKSHNIETDTRVERAGTVITKSKQEKVPVSRSTDRNKGVKTPRDQLNRQNDSVKSSLASPNFQKSTGGKFYDHGEM